MGNTLLVKRFALFFILAIFSFEKASSFTVVEFDLQVFGWDLKLADDNNNEEDNNDIIPSPEVAYPENVGSWSVTPCIKLKGAITILVPVLLPSGVSQTFPLDVPPEATTEGFCSDPLYSIFTGENIKNSITFKWGVLHEGSAEILTNKLSIVFEYSYNGGFPMFSISSITVSYSNAQFVEDILPRRIDHQEDNLSLFPTFTSNSLQCEKGELKAAFDSFHIHFYDAQWQAFKDNFENEDFDTPEGTPEGCVPLQNTPDLVTGDHADFWKVWFISTVVVLLICLAVTGLLLFVTMFFVKRCRAENDEGYETFA